jgi:hypothetical protein
VGAAAAVKAVAQDTAELVRAEIELAKALPSRFFKNSIVESLKFSLVGRNLAMLYKKAPHIDPETGFSSANGQQGQEFGQYPSARNIGFNVNLKF